MTIRLAFVTASLILLSGVASAQPPSAKPVAIEIPALPLNDALKQLARQAGFQVVFYSRESEGVNAPGISGKFTAEQALGELLAGTELTFEFVNGNTVAIRAKGEERRPVAGGSAEGVLRVAQVDAAENLPDQQKESTAAPPADSAGELEEIVVTAQKRVERLQDVPVPVTVISAQSLVDNNQLRLQDYYNKIPGLSMTPQRDAPVLAVRGITTGSGTNPSVSVIVDDVPYGSSTNQGGGSLAPDFDPSDLERVEVLRGPQGTLYGASSLGGLFKFVTIDPSTERLSGRVQAGTSSVRNGDELGYNIRGSVNVPLGDALAVRASGFTRRDPGYIDDVRRGIDGINRVDVDGGRLSALWAPSQNLSLKFSALLQDTQARGASYSTLRSDLGDLQQDGQPDTGWYDRKLEVYAAILKANLGDVELTAASGYGVNTLSDALDFGGGFMVPENNKTNKFSQEVRLSAPIGNRVDWLFGAFYTRERSQYQQTLNFASTVTGEVLTTIGVVSFPTVFAEYAAFTDLTFNITDRFDFQVGGRGSQNRQTLSSIGTGALVGATLPEDIHSKESAFTYLVTPRFRLSPDFMVYARLASGYRPGGPNNILPTLGAPLQYDADTTQNYEIGIKGSVLDRMLFFDASVYYIDWKKIQLTLTVPGVGSYYDNGGRAKSQGVEFSVELRPRTGLAIAGWVSWNDAELTEDFPASSQAIGLSGDRLPLSSRFSGNFAVEQKFPLASKVVGVVAGSMSYVGERRDEFKLSPLQQRQVFPAYARTDVRAAVEYDSWTVNLFVNNIADRRGVYFGNPSASNLVFYIQPRTIGLSVAKTF